MPVKTLLFFLVLILSCTFVSAQKKKQPVRKTVSRSVETVQTNFNLVPEIKDYAFVVNVDKDSNVSLSIQKTEDSEFLADTSNTKSLTDFFSSFSALQNSRTANKLQSPLDPIVIIKADSSLKYGAVINVIQASRISFTQKIKVETARDFYAIVPQKPDKSKSISQSRPNPLTLVVKLDENKNLTLNNEEQGSLNDTSQIKKILQEIFKEREDNGVFREGTNVIEKTIYIKAPLSVEFFDVIKIANALRDAGTDSIGLQVDDIQ
jgi:biopolymer transport protein ExbD